MKSFGELAPLSRALLTNWSLLLCFLGAWVLVYDRRIKRTVPALLPGAPLLAGSYLLLQCHLLVIAVNCGKISPDARYRRICGLPALWIVALLCLLSVLELLALLRSVRWARGNITLMSIKEGIDQLDTGLCYYWPGGIVKLANPKMQELCRILTGGPIQSGETLWEAVKADPIPMLPDGSVWSFQRRELPIEDEVIIELTAAEVTEEYRLIRELREKEAELSDYHRRLEAYGSAVDEVTVQEETLAMKMSIHDELGRTLLASRRYLETPGNERAAREEIARLWKNAIRMGMRAAAVPSAEGTLRDITDAGRAIGIGVRVEGALPENTRIMGLLTAGARTALTNAYRHGRATELRIRIRQVGQHYEIVYTNNGLAPVAPAAEGGGLSTLRETVEKQGGQMTLRWTPEFALQITVG